MTLREEFMVRRALADLKLLLVGGDPRPNAIENIQSMLRLESVIHCPTRKTDASARSFISNLHTPRLALVVCARGLTRTHHGHVLHDRCRKLGLPLLNCNHLPHPNALIAAIVRERMASAVVRRCQLLKPNIALVTESAA